MLVPFSSAFFLITIPLLLVILVIVGAIATFIARGSDKK